METKYYQIDEAAKLANITERTLRYYEDIGLFKPTRSDANCRLYSEEDIEVIREIKNLRVKLGMNIEQIQHFLGLKDTIKAVFNGSVNDTEGISKARDMVKEYLIALEERISLLERIRMNGISYLKRMDEKLEQ